MPIVSNKIDASELEKLRSVVSSIQEFKLEYGEISFQLKMLELKKESLNSSLEELYLTINALEEENLKLANFIESKYGVCNINLEDGTITKI